jgi:hypothetical protein
VKIFSDRSYFKNAKQRAKRRKSPWNFALIPFAIAGIGLVWFVFVRILLLLQNKLIPTNTIFSNQTSLGAILLYIPPIFPAICLGLVVANILLWSIRPAREILDKEAEGTKGASFIDSTKGLLRLSIIFIIITTPISLLGVKGYFYILEDGIYICSLFHLKSKHYNWKDIEEIHTRCLLDRRNLDLNYELVMKDGQTIDLMKEHTLDFVKIYNRLIPYIHMQKNIAYKKEISPLGLQRLQKHYSLQDANEILKVLGQEQL